MNTVIVDRLIKTLGLGSGAKKYLVNTSWLFLEQAVRMGVGLFISVWIIRYLGPDRYGILSYAQSMVLLLGAVAKLGIDHVLVRELVRKEYRTGTLLGTALMLKLIGATVVVLTLATATDVMDMEPVTRLLVLIIAAGTLFKSFDVIGLFFESQVRSKYTVSANMFGFIILVLTKITLLLTKAPLVAFAIVIGGESALYAASLLYYYQRLKLPIGSWSVDRSLMGVLLQQSWPLILSGIAINIGMRIDQIMLKSYMDAASVGVYAAGVKIAEVFNFLPMIIGRSLYPKIVSMDMEKEEHKMRRMVRDVFYALVGVSLLVTLASYPTVMILYGEGYEESYMVVSILIWTIPIVYSGIMTNRILLKHNQSRIIFIRQTQEAVVNIGLNLFLIPRYGITGAAAATLLAMICTMIAEYIIPATRWIFWLKLRYILFLK